MGDKEESLHGEQTSLGMDWQRNEKARTRSLERYRKWGEEADSAKGSREIGAVKRTEACPVARRLVLRKNRNSGTSQLS